MVAGGSWPGNLLGGLVALAISISRPLPTTRSYFTSPASPCFWGPSLYLIFLNRPLFGRYLLDFGVVSARNIVRAIGNPMVMFLSAPGLLILTEIWSRCLPVWNGQWPIPPT